MAESRRDTPQVSAEHVVVHDFSGHPFQVQLARALARRQRRVTHLYCPSFQTPKGDVETGDRDGGSFESRGVALRGPFAKYSGGKRLIQELEYGWRLTRAVRSLRPDVVISGNTPLIAAFVFHLAMKLLRIPVVFWQQDVYSTALAEHLQSRAGRAGALAGKVFVQMERWAVRSSSHVVAISADFVPNLLAWGVPRQRISVVENWAPLDELPQRPRANSWAARHGLRDDDIVFLYAGTLGLKHEPSLLLDLSTAFASRPDVRVIVASEGLGADWLREHGAHAQNLQLIPFQPYDELPDMLAAADVLVVLLEADAGGFSVPSKVLTYHCAGRPLLGAMPHENLASRNIAATGSGLVVGPGDSEAFVTAAKRLADDPSLRDSMGTAARAYAERTFDIEHITDSFERILASARTETRR